MANAPVGDALYFAEQKQSLSQLLYVSKQGLQGLDVGEFRPMLRLHDSQAERQTETFTILWQQFWRWFDLWQFLPHQRAVSSTSVERGEPAAAPVETGLPLAWQEAIELAEELEPLLRACWEAGAAVPEIGFELPESAEGFMAEAAWEGAKVAVFLGDQEKDRAAFVDVGWRGFSADDVAGVLGAL
jgi:hypothetical protein